MSVESTAAHWRRVTESIVTAYLRVKEKGYEFTPDEIIRFIQKHELSKAMNAQTIEKFLKENKLAKQHLTKNLMVKI